MSDIITPESIVDQLPPRPRVHQLAKALGLTSKEVLADLGELGVELRSASAVVPAQAISDVVARRIPAEVTPIEAAEAAVEVAAEPVAEEVPAVESVTTPRTIRRAASRPAGPPVEVEAPISVPATTAAAPLTTDPSPTVETVDPPKRRRRATRPAGSPMALEPADRVGVAGADQGGGLGTGESTDRVGVAGADQGGDPVAGESTASDPVAAAVSELLATASRADSAESTAKPEPREPRTRRRRAARRERAAEAMAAESAQDDQNEEPTDDDGIAAALRLAEEAAKARRVAVADPFAVTAQGRTETLAALADAIAEDNTGGEDAETEEVEEETTEDSPEDEERPGRRRRRRGGRRRRRGREEEGTEAAESEEEPVEEAGETQPKADEDTDEEDESGTRRRRRRRRRSSATELKGGLEDEVTGIEGSTRMEAKRQRRKENRAAGRRRAPILSEAEFLARRESVDRQLVIRQQSEYTQLAVIEDGILVEHYVDRASATSLIGNIYLGRVQNVLPSMEAAFIDIGRGRNAVLYAGEVDWDSFGVAAEDRKVEKVFKSGQAVLVQVTKDPVGAKGARLTGHISLPGRYIVYSPGGHLSGISRKLPDVERNRLRQILGGLIGDDESVIVRTAAEGVQAEELVRDVNRLKAQWEIIEKKVAAGKAPEVLYSEPDLTLRIVRDLFTEDFGKLIVQGDDAFESISAYVGHVAPHLSDRVTKFEPEADGEDLFAQYRIDEQIAKALERKVFLPSGGSLVIDRTEAMTVIDVNTGRFTGSGGNLEATVTSNNLEAAEEIVRQLRLRDLGGIIVIDFIDMVLPSNRELLLRRLVECLGRDRTRHQVAEVTSLGLVQLTRKRIGTGLAEAFTEECEHCHGAGYLRYEDPVDSQAPADGGERKNGRRRKKGTN